MKKKRFPVSAIVANAILCLVCCFCVLPVLLLVISSFTDNDTVFKNGYSFFPEKWSLGAYEYLVTQSETITRAYGISIFITLVGTVAGLLFTAMFGYALSRKIIRGRRGLNFYVFFTLLFNGGMVPTYLMYVNTFHIKNTLWALLIPSNILVNGFNILLMRTYFDGNVPNELIESGKIDGAGEFRIFLQIVLPISTPILATVGLLIGVG